MSEEPVICRYVFTPKEYSRAMNNYWRHSKTKWILLVVLVPGTYGTYADLFPAPGTQRVSSLSILLYDVLPVAFVMVVIAVLARYAGQIHFRRSAFCNKEMIFTLREAGVHVKSPLSESEMKWGIYAQATESRHGFSLFHQGKRMFNWLPKHALVDHGEIHHCRELLRRHVKDAKKLFALEDPDKP
jgi:hypothetical protein